MSNSTTKILSIEKLNLNKPKGIKKPDFDSLPVLPTRDLVLFPFATVPISLRRKPSVLTAERAHTLASPVAVICQNNPLKEEPVSAADMLPYGVVADIIDIVTLPDDTKMALVKAREKIKVIDIFPSPAIPGALSCKAEPVKERKPRRNDKEMASLIEQIRRKAKDILSNSTDNRPDISFNFDNIEQPDELINVIATLMPFSTEIKRQLLAESSCKDRAFAVLTQIAHHEQLMEINREIGEKTHRNLTAQQRTAFLHQQMDTIKRELYGDDDPETEIRRLKEKAQSLDLSDEVRKVFDREVSKLSRLAPQSPDYAVLYSYLELVTDLPWNSEDPVNRDIESARSMLEEDHYGLEKVKERVLEQIAMIINSPDGRSPIICLVGAPGVGKTSLGQSVARALGRKYRRVALGGLHDESEIRGHRRTYIGAMPGRIIDALRRAGSKNPVILLDEIDKIGSDFHGDPSAALLEVLDPEQNFRFHDNYVDVDFDLSKVLFIATANTLSTVPPPLVDRMEIIDISGYVIEEKINIARRHLIPKLLREASLSPDDFSITDEALIRLIETYTSESGVRQLEKQLASLVRKAVLHKVSSKKLDIPIEASHLAKLLGAPSYLRERYEGNEYPGVVTGLAWTAAGGCVLTIEASISKAKGEHLTLTGNLGDVMKESASIALQYVKAHADNLAIPAERFTDFTLHIHVPEGAIPKDGPSAGITMATAIASAFTGRKIAPRLAMTGELTLRGKVLPVGGIKEKILAAKRSGISRVILPAHNRKDVDEIKPEYLIGLEIEYVDDISRVFDIALLS